jgi:hypothetical protein
VVPPETHLSERHGEIPAWDEIEAEMKPVLVRQRDVYAGFLEDVDHHLGQLVDGLANLEILDNTLQGFAHLETADYLRERIDSESRSPSHSIDD